MNVPRGVIPVLITGGVAAAAALFIKFGPSLKSQQPRRRRQSNRVLTVRVTQNGRKYHRDDCPLLHGQHEKIPLVEAVEHYEPCKACHPPGS